MPGAAFEEVGEGGPDRERHAEDIDEAIERQCSGDSSRNPRLPQAGVREHRVDAAERVERRLRQRLVIVPLGHVAPHADRALRASELLGEVVESILAPGAEDQPIAGLRGAPWRWPRRSRSRHR